MRIKIEFWYTAVESDIVVIQQQMFLDKNEVLHDFIVWELNYRCEYKTWNWFQKYELLL